MGMVKKCVVIHCDFNIPPEHDPLTGIIHRERNDSFYTSSSEMIIDKYLLNFSKKDIKIHRDEIVSLYSLINFSFSPFLLNYIEKEHPQLYFSIIESTIISKKIYGEINAIARVYNNSILPLLPLDKKKLYIHWGIENYKRHFKTTPFLIHLTQNEADEETLEVLIEKGIKSTILSITSIKKIKDLKTNQEISISSAQDIDITIPYIYRSKFFKDKYIKIFLYNNELIKLLQEKQEDIIPLIKALFSKAKSEQYIILPLTLDHRGVFLNDKINPKEIVKMLIKEKDISLTNLSLSKSQSNFEIEIHPPSSSLSKDEVNECKDESQAIKAQAYKYSRWKKDVKEIVDDISEKIDKIYLKNTIDILKNPIETLKIYPDIYEAKDPHKALRFIEENSKRALKPWEITLALESINMQMEVALCYLSDVYYSTDITDDLSMNNIKRIIKLINYLDENNIEIKDVFERLKRVDNRLDNIIEEIKRKSLYSDGIYAGEFALFLTLNFINPFSRSFFHPKVIKREKDFFVIKIDNINTLASSIWNIEIIKEKENPLIKIKKEKDESFFPLVLYDLSILSQKIYKILTSTQEKYLFIKKLLYSLSEFDGSFERLKIIKELYKNLISGYTDNQMPLIIEITKFIIKKLDRNLKEDKEILELIYQKKILYPGSII